MQHTHGQGVFFAVQDLAHVCQLVLDRLPHDVINRVLNLHIRHGRTFGLCAQKVCGHQCSRPAECLPGAQALLFILQASVHLTPPKRHSIG